MGVRGLTTFIKNNERKYLKPHRLHDCTVLLDGNCIASNLFIWSNIDPAFGGDYDKFSKYVKEFFKGLIKCKINALVIFDGGYEQRKLKTVYSRLRDKYRSVRDSRPLSRTVTFPLFMRVVFREALVELNIPFAQSDFEADDELAALARQLNCPVISNDSDFYIYDVLYIPFPSMDLIPIKLEEGLTDGSNVPKYCIECKIYNVDLFIDSFGGLEKNMLPLLAALLGNDYIKRSVFKAFYENLKIPKGKTNPLQRRIKAVIEWLRNESFGSAIRKILSRMKWRSRRRVMGQMKKIIQGYVTSTSFMSDYLGSITAEETSKTENVRRVDSNVMDIVNEIEEHIDAIQDEDSKEPLHDESNEYDEIFLSESDNELDEEESAKEDIIIDEATSITKGSKNIPDWLLEYARRGKIHSCVIDILSLRQYFCPPQVEDHSLTPSHYISLPILNFIVGLLVGDSEHLFRYWTRNNSALAWYTLEPSCQTASLTFPPCNEIMNINESVRRKALLEITGVHIELSHLPDEWHLFVIAAVFWLRNMKQPEVSEAHFHTTMMCLVAIYTIDLRIGVHRNNQTFSRKYKNLLNKIIESRTKEKNLKESKAPDPSSDNTNPTSELAKVSHEDCVLAFGTILPYHHLNENIKSKPKQFCTFTIHAFAQFQSVLYHLIVLNSVLGFPFKEPFVSHLYSGTFVYNMYTNLSKKTNIVACVESLFQSAPSLQRLYKSLVALLKEPLADIELQKHSKKSHKKKRRSKQGFTLSGEIERNHQEEDELFYDENNIFSRLSINA